MAQNKKEESVFGTSFQEFVYIRTYSRWLDKEKRRETWPETVKRYCDFMKSEIGDAITDKDYKDVYNAIYNLEVMPSMRALWAAGKAAKADNIAMYNCSYLVIDSLSSFSEMLYILMNGTGVGFSVERKYVNKLPIIEEHKKAKARTVVFEDSKLGWARGLDDVLRCLWGGIPFKCDYSKIRPKGARLKTFGGRASGPGPLKDLVAFTSEVVERNRGSQIQCIDAHDICCKIADIVVVGGTRRSALISLSDLTDNQMATAKQGQFWLTEPQRKLSNNSVAYTRKPDVLSFIQEWSNLIKSQSGERGIVNRVALKNKAEENSRRDPNHDLGTNPCFGPQERLLTTNGFKTFEELDGQEVEIINAEGHKSSSKVWCSGIKPTVSVKNTFKQEIICTPDHLWMLNDGSECRAENLQGKRLMPAIARRKTDFDTKYVKLGFCQGDANLSRLRDKDHKGFEINIGNKDDDILKLFGFERETEDQRKFYSRDLYKECEKLGFIAKPLPERYLPSSFVCWTTSQKISFIRGLFSANGCVINNTRIALKTTCKELVEGIKNWFSEEIGIDLYITTNKEKVVSFSNGDYPCKESYDLNIGTFEGLLWFYRNIGFVHGYKDKKLKEAVLTKSPLITSVKDAGESEVYDFTEPETHWGIVNGYVAHNCGEVILRPYEFCNLTEVVVRPKDNFKTLKEKVRIATMMGTWQSSFTDFKYINKQWKKNCEEERLLGVSLTGVRDHRTLGHVNDTAKKWLSDLKHVAIASNKKWAAKLKINESAAITTNKPSGCQKKETMISTAFGIASLEELGDINGCEWQTHKFPVIDDKDTFKESTKFYCNGLSETIKLKMKSGLELEATGNHRYKVFKDGKLYWKRAEDIKSGDVLPFVLDTYKNTDNYMDLIEVGKPYHNVKDIKQPTILNEDLAWFLGLYYGDGSNHNKGIRIAGHSEHVTTLEKARDIAKEVFGVEGIIYYRTKSDYNADLYLNSTYLSSWLSLNQLSKGKSGDLEIPLIIRKSPRSVIESFLDGYWEADGCLATGTGLKNYVTISKRMAEQIVVVLRALGRDASYREMKPTESSWGKNMRYWIQERKGRSGDYKRTIYSKIIQELDSVGLTNLTPDYVINSSISENKTYDIEVPDGNTYVANSYISHNTVSSLVNSSAGLHRRIGKYQIRRVRVNASDPLSTLLKDQGIPWNPEVGELPESCSTYVFDFIIEAPTNTGFQKDLTAKEQLEFWQMYRSFWCVSGDTQVLTDTGYYPIEDLVDKEINAWNGESFKTVKPFKTGTQKLYRVYLSNGVDLKCTKDHKFILNDGTRIPLKDIKIGDKLKKFDMPIISSHKGKMCVDAYSQGFYSGDGFSGSDYSHVYENKYMCIDRLAGKLSDKEFKSRKAKQWNHGHMLDKSFVPFNLCVTDKINWLAGLIDADGNKLGNGIQITSICKEFLRDTQLMLTTLGVISNVKQKHDGVLKEMPDSNGGLKQYQCKPLFTLLISGFNLNKLIELGLKTERVELVGKDSNYDKLVSITDIEELESEETYCFTEPETNRGTFNGIVTGQCEHNPSISIYVKNHEWLYAAAWVEENFDEIGGVSFFPYSDHVYQLAPNEAVSEKTHRKMKKNYPVLDFNKLTQYEHDDQTTAAKEYACTGDKCDIR